MARWTLIIAFFYTLCFAESYAERTVRPAFVPSELEQIDEKKTQPILAVAPHGASYLTIDRGVFVVNNILRETSQPTSLATNGYHMCMMSGDGSTVIVSYGDGLVKCENVGGGGKTVEMQFELGYG